MAAWCKYAERQSEKQAPVLCNKNLNRRSAAEICGGQKYCKVTGRFEMSDRVKSACKHYKTK